MAFNLASLVKTRVNTPSCSDRRVCVIVDASSNHVMAHALKALRPPAVRSAATT
jgi:hypothetical protein